MRVLTESARYTQDLAFDHDPHQSFASLQKTIRSGIDRALKESGLLEASVTAPTQTDTVARWKVSARTELGSMLRLTVEVSRRARPDPDHVVRIPIQLPDLTLPRIYVTVYDDRSLAGQKLAAILDERRTVVRDFACSADRELGFQRIVNAR